MANAQISGRRQHGWQVTAIASLGVDGIVNFGAVVNTTKVIGFM